MATQHPTGLTAALTTILVWGALKLGVEIPAEVAVAIVGVLTTIVSYFTPRTTQLEVGTPNDEITGDVR
ncbi:MAG: hypothetical protein KGZ65_06230 [Sphingomonadales bacterium]|nr:hypothetical protein [Sphingomonadaceae bacterium]MBS3930817.1 hypothetical protein [Sphingomonadales bacterium]